MAAVKKFNTTYTIDTTDVYLTGNLHVIGVYDTTNVTNTNVQDKDIALNVGESGWGVGGNAAPSQSGLIIDRGLQANVALRWNEIYDNWEVTTDGSTYANILTTSGGGLTAVVQDTSPKLGGNLATNGFHINFQTPTITPTITGSGNTLVYAGTVGGGGSGLYIVNGSSSGQELVTKTQAIVFSLIL
jgi:hypothetical protein